MNFGAKFKSLKFWEISQRHLSDVDFHFIEFSFQLIFISPPISFDEMKININIFLKFKIFP